MSGNSFSSWGRYPRAEQRTVPLSWIPDSLPASEGTILAAGMGRSYGDSCLNDGNTLLLARGLGRLRSFDAQTGVLVCEAGTSFDEILAFAVPRGWFLPVTPGTRFVTVAGAIANDVHGKNHHFAGCFGHFVNRFGLLRSDRGSLVCSTSEEPALFAATIGGMGLTGLIQWAEVQLKPIPNSYIDMESIRFDDLGSFFELSRESEERFEYVVSWIDCLSPSFRGLFMRGNHNQSRPRVAAAAGSSRLSIPFDFPEWALNSTTVSIFNNLYYRKQFKRLSLQCVHYEPFFYPLDAIGDWNRIYGRGGFLQWQCLVPMKEAAAAIPVILREVVASRQASFLSVLKTMGGKPSRGLLSFSGEGVTVALDFHCSPEVFRLLDRLDALVAETGGRLYPAKDARMSAEFFQQAYPRWRELEQMRDPRFSSSFWRRVTQ